MINCFYSTTSNLAFATEVKYLYNPGDTANTVSGNLASLEFPSGFQLSVLGNVNAASGSGTASTSTAGLQRPFKAAFRPNAASTNSSSTPSPQQAVQTLTQGGNFALNGLLPIVNLRGMHMQLLSVADPKMGFEISGLSSQNTVTGASDVNENLSSETYFQIEALPSTLGADSPGSIFFDYRGGWEHVDSTFVKNAGLKSGNSFGLQQFSAGLVVNGFLRISGQRFFGPEQAFVNTAGQSVTANNFKNWQLAIQLVPSTGKSKKTTGANTN